MDIVDEAVKASKIDPESYPKSIGEVNQYLKSKGVKEKLVKGKGYYYFVDGNTDNWYESSVYVYRISDMRFSRWYGEWESKANNSRNHDGEDKTPANTRFIKPIKRNMASDEAKFSKKAQQAFDLVMKGIKEGPKLTKDKKKAFALNLLNKVYNLKDVEREAVYKAVNVSIDNADEAAVEKEIIGVKEMPNKVWRITYDGKILGDDRGYPDKNTAVAEARKRVAKHGGKSGDWVGSTWVDKIKVLAKDIAAETSLVKTLKPEMSKTEFAALRVAMLKAAKMARARGFKDDFDLSGLRTLYQIAQVQNKHKFGSSLKNSAIDKALKKLLPELNASKDTAARARPHAEIKSEYNWIKTGGAVGKRRRLPGFLIYRHKETGKFFVVNEKDDTTVASGYDSVDSAVKANAFRVSHLKDFAYIKVSGFAQTGNFIVNYYDKAGSRIKWAKAQKDDSGYKVDLGNGVMSQPFATEAALIEYAKTIDNPEAFMIDTARVPKDAVPKNIILRGKDAVSKFITKYNLKGIGTVALSDVPIQPRSKWLINHTVYSSDMGKIALVEKFPGVTVVVKLPDTVKITYNKRPLTVSERRQAELMGEADYSSSKKDTAIYIHSSGTVTISSAGKIKWNATKDTAASISGKDYDDLEKAIFRAFDVLYEPGKTAKKNYKFTMADMWQFLSMINTDMSEKHHLVQRQRPRVAKYVGGGDGLRDKFYARGLYDNHIKTALKKVLTKLNAKAPNLDTATYMHNSGTTLNIDSNGNLNIYSKGKIKLNVAAKDIAAITEWKKGIFKHPNGGYAIGLESGQVAQNTKAVGKLVIIGWRELYGEEIEMKQIGFGSLMKSKKDPKKLIATFWVNGSKHSDEASASLNLSEADLSKINDIKAPYVNSSLSKLGGAGRYSIMFTVSAQPKADWKNGILENSRYGKFALNSDGSLECHSGRLSPTLKFRKTRVKSVDEAVAKVNKFMTAIKQVDTANINLEDMARDGTPDTHMIDAMVLWYENDGTVYKAMQNLAKNYARKIATKRYDANKAVYGWLNIVNAFLPKFKKEDGTINLSGATRLAAAKELMERNQDEMVREYSTDTAKEENMNTDEAELSESNVPKSHKVNFKKIPKNLLDQKARIPVKMSKYGDKSEKRDGTMAEWMAMYAHDPVFRIEKNIQNRPGDKKFRVMVKNSNGNYTTTFTSFPSHKAAVEAVNSWGFSVKTSRGGVKDTASEKEDNMTEITDDTAAGAVKPYFYVYSKEKGDKEWNQEGGFKTSTEAKEEIEFIKSPGGPKYRIVKVPYKMKWTELVSDRIQATLDTRTGSGIVDCMDCAAVNEDEAALSKNSFYIVIHDIGGGKGKHVLTTKDHAKVRAKCKEMYKKGERFKVTMASVSGKQKLTAEEIKKYLESGPARKSKAAPAKTDKVFRTKVRVKKKDTAKVDNTDTAAKLDLTNVISELMSIIFTVPPGSSKTRPWRSMRTTTVRNVLNALASRIQSKLSGFELIVGDNWNIKVTLPREATPRKIALALRA